MRILLFALQAALVALPAMGQDAYSPVLGQIERNSPTLAALREQAEVRRLAGRTDIFPADPEVEFGYLWGAPAAVGARKDVSVRQSFDFPAVYARRGRLAESLGGCAEWLYRSQRMELLLSAKRVCIELVYYNGLAELYGRMLENARLVADAYGKREQSGDANRLDFNKARLNLASMEGEASRADIERARLLSELARLNGGAALEFGRSEYAPTPLAAAVFEEWYAAAAAASPALQYLLSQVEVGERRVELSCAQSLPSFSLGYMGEFVSGQNYQGVTLGLSIPLWENRNKVRLARAEARASVAAAEDAKIQYYNRLKSLHARVAELSENVRRYASALSEGDNDRLLREAYSAGEISLLSYLLELDYLVDVRVKLLQAERDYELALAELNAAAL